MVLSNRTAHPITIHFTFPGVMRFNGPDGNAIWKTPSRGYAQAIMDRTLAPGSSLAVGGARWDNTFCDPKKPYGDGVKGRLSPGTYFLHGSFAAGIGDVNSHNRETWVASTTFTVT